MSKKEEALTIQTILSKDKYLVPIYQRNYEWEKEQISKLIEDINSISENENYYLGTLVTFKRRDNKFELIDGQQRHTTLNLIKAVLNRDSEEFNLEFQSRPECDYFIKSLSKNNFEKLYENEKSINLFRGIQIVKDVFQELNIDKNKFANAFFYQTYLFRTELPKDTDLNHYFEIMNNRGEQLEKHEILKAQLMKVFEEDIVKEIVFSKIWDACSYMGNYIWNNFKKEDAIQLFEGETTDCFSFENLVHKLSPPENFNAIEDNNIFPKDILSEIIQNHKIPTNFSQENQEATDKYRSVINFPTLLLYVFYILSPEENNSFEDKKLLDVFKNFNKTEEFILELLKIRIYYDKYIVKNDLSNESDSKWGIRSFEISSNEIKTKETTFEDSRYEDKIEMLQSMFYYSTISNNKKEWLLELLENKPKTDNGIYESLLRNFKSNINNLDLNGLKYPEIPTKIFYYFDYMLWEIYFDYVKPQKNLDENLEILKVRIKSKEKIFNKYRFRQLNSKEHLLSQNKFYTFQEQLNLCEEDLNSFANLCLISTSENSSASNDNHYEKKSRFENNETSLKRLMMFETFHGNLWNKECMNNHLQDMFHLLKYYQNK